MGTLFGTGVSGGLFEQAYADSGNRPLSRTIANCEKAASYGTERIPLESLMLSKRRYALEN